MPERKPSLKDISITKKPSARIQEFIKETRDTITTHDIDSREDWLTKMRIARNMRQGIKRVSDNPYPGAPDIPLPETDKIIKKQKPRFVLAALAGKRFMKVVAMEGVQSVTPEMKEAAKRVNMAMNFVFQNPHQEWLQKLTLAADNFLEKGHCIFKIV